MRYHKEPLKPNELDYIINIEADERMRLQKVCRLLMLLALVVSCAGALFGDGETHRFSVLSFLTTMLVLLSIITFATISTYLVFHRKLQKDIREKTKTIERNKVCKKLCIEQSQTCHCFINSRVKLAVEVSYYDYLHLDVGDEICIEYTTHARQYLGYF